jgi:hypothetical protein
MQGPELKKRVDALLKAISSVRPQHFNHSLNGESKRRDNKQREKPKERAPKKKKEQNDDPSKEEQEEGFNKSSCKKHLKEVQKELNELKDMQTNRKMSDEVKIKKTKEVK